MRQFRIVSSILERYPLKYAVILYRVKQLATC